MCKKMHLSIHCRKSLLWLTASIRQMESFHNYQFQTKSKMCCAEVIPETQCLLNDLESDLCAQETDLSLAVGICSSAWDSHAPEHTSLKEALPQNLSGLSVPIFTALTSDWQYGNSSALPSLGALFLYVIQGHAGFFSWAVIISYISNNLVTSAFSLLNKGFFSNSLIIPGSSELMSESLSHIPQGSSSAVRIDICFFSID